jgi:hypothetical protein
MFINMSIALWLGADSSIDGHERKLFIALFLVSAALLFCIARWGNNRLKRDELPFEPDEEEDDDDDDDD